MTAEVAQASEEHPVVPERKNFDVRNVIVEKVTGTVKWFSVSRHYGFIQRDDNKEDVFVHRTAITASRSRYPTLKNGETVEFSVVETDSGVNAASVTGPNGQDVQGVRFHRRPKPNSEGEGQPRMNGTSQAGGDMEGTRQRGGPRRMRRGRRNFRPSQNGMGDGENAEGGSGEQGEEQGSGAEGSRPLRQRPRRFRGGGGGRGRGARSTSSRQPGDNAGTEGEEEGATANLRPQGGQPRRGGGRFRRGGGRPRRGPGNQGSRAEGSGAANTDEGLDRQMEGMTLEENKESSSGGAAAHQPSAETGAGDASAKAAEASN